MQLERSVERRGGTPAEVEQWLTGSAEEALALQRPSADDAIELLPSEKKAA